MLHFVLHFVLRCGPSCPPHFLNADICDTFTTPNDTFTTPLRHLYDIYDDNIPPTSTEICQQVSKGDPNKSHKFEPTPASTSRCGLGVSHTVLGGGPSGVGSKKAGRYRTGGSGVAQGPHLDPYPNPHPHRPASTPTLPDPKSNETNSNKD